MPSGLSSRGSSAWNSLQPRSSCLSAEHCKSLSPGNANPYAHLDRSQLCAKQVLLCSDGPVCYRRAVQENDEACAGTSLHVFIELAECVPEDAIKLQPSIWQYILPAPEEYPHAWALVPALLKHALVHIRVRFHDGVRAGPPLLDGLQIACAASWPGVCHGVGLSYTQA